MKFLLSNFVVYGRIVIGGPSNSGKSTLAPVLRESLNLIGIHTYHHDYDPFSPTRDYVLKKISDKERINRKSTITEKEASEKAKEFCNLGSDYDLVIGDLPGTTNPTTSILATGGTHAIILYSEEKINEKDEWINLFNAQKIPIISILESNLTGHQKICDGKIITGKVSNLNRDAPPSANSIILIELAEAIGKKFQ